MSKNDEEIVLAQCSGTFSHRSAALQVVSNLRLYREVAKKLIRCRYKDGAVDGATMERFKNIIEEIENNDNPIIDL